MKIDIKHVARLANLTLSPDEEARFEKQLEETLEYVESLDQIDTADVSETNTVVDTKNVMREDDVKPSLTQEQALANTPNKKNGLFVVKAILEKE